MSGYQDAWYCDEHEHSVEPSLCVVCLAAEVEALLAQVQRVRAACEHQRCYGEYGPDAEVVAAVPVHVLLHALDGGDDD